MTYEAGEILLQELRYPGLGERRYFAGDQQIDVHDTSKIVSIIEEAMTWPTELLTRKLAKRGITYVQPELVLVDSTTMVDGEPASAVGPFYNPEDNKIYIDPTFFEQQLMNLEVDGDIWAITVAYVVLHETGHYIQFNIGEDTGIVPTNEELEKLMDSDPILVEEPNLLQIGIELQADCIAGMLLNAEDKRKSDTVENGDAREIEEDASDIGDDVIMMHYGLPPMAEEMTHGTAKMRRAALKHGLTLHDISQVPHLKHFINIAKQVYRDYRMGVVSDIKIAA